MIVADQPTCFDDSLLVAMSSRSDGTMLDRSASRHAPQVVANRRKFCQQLAVPYEDVVFMGVLYLAGRRYDCIVEVDAAATARHTPDVVADALVTRTPGVALMLTEADCVAVVMYDVIKGLLALLHLGRHSTVANLMQRMVEKFIHEGSKPEDIIVWMSPSAQQSTYVMKYFDQATDPVWQPFYKKHHDGYYLDMQGYNASICPRAGIPSSNIHISPINTMTDPHYFSHAQGDTTGRTAVVAMMRG